MPMKASGLATEWQEIDRHEHGVGWIAYPDETMQRASHAIESDGDVWVIDPVDVEGLDDLLAEFGEVAGVVILLDRHKRDAAKVANRHDVSVYIPSFFDGVAEELDASVKRFSNALGDSGYRLHTVVDNTFWKEGALYNQETGDLFVPEAVGTTDYFHTEDRELGVHPMLRLFPPDALEVFEPTRIHVGHGPGVDDRATAKLRDALSGSRARTPRLYLKTARDMIFD
ncbi:hypothetical protein [Halovenus amylolytica]|uniref:hypothetical protein n=1 Tax=Halovenus amylolytica TaxID=2500550 RepID=UPI00361C25A4